MKVWARKKTAPPPTAAKRTVPPDCAPDRGAQSGARPGRTGSNKAPAPSARAPLRTADRLSDPGVIRISHPISDQRLVSRLRWPFAQRLLSLACARSKLAKAVDRRIAPEKSIEHVGKQIRAAAHKLPLVQFHFDASASRRQIAVDRLQNGELSAQPHFHDPADLVLEIGRVSEVMQPQYLLEGSHAFF